jgi:hypothetical protein
MGCGKKFEKDANAEKAWNTGCQKCKSKDIQIFR